MSGKRKRYRLHVTVNEDVAETLRAMAACQNRSTAVFLAHFLSDVARTFRNMEAENMLAARPDHLEVVGYAKSPHGNCVECQGETPITCIRCDGFVCFQCVTNRAHLCPEARKEMS